MAGPDRGREEGNGLGSRQTIAPDDEDQAQEGEQAGPPLPGGTAQTLDQALTPGGGEEADGMDAQKNHQADNEEGHACSLRELS